MLFIVVNFLLKVFLCYCYFSQNAMDDGEGMGLSKRMRTCGRKQPAGETSMKYYFDYRMGECIGFKYHPSCGGRIDQEVFDYRPECIRNGYSLQDWAIACWGAWQPVKRSQKPCKQNPCPSGTACRVTGAVQPSDARETVCCNTTLLGLKKSTNVYTCIDGHSAWKGPFADGMLRPVLAETCRDMVCHGAYECRQQNALFAKCCYKYDE